MEIEVAGERVRLHAERALLWRDTAWIADVHWGKSASFRRAGLPVPDGELDEDLARVGALMREVARVVVLGDLVHAAVDAHTATRVAAWRASHPTPMQLVRGNHDRHQALLPPEWKIEELGPEHLEGPFRFVHEPSPGAAFTWAGHLHPGVVVGAGADWLRLPCFHLGPRLGILPAFGRFTGSARLKVGPDEAAWAIVEDRVLRVA